ncbi:hypothetical protein M406DRAFT_61582 [Cryphonectria parasitica EP155]|uniref:SAP domain-containing protein n=1 Tax=Cryphonectria parasitica (strain ATCC 38755 / EP155) TaxID=660469 RepID=A0A9P4Y817_CRYP1|nr:uncharacterized protein M406DRAFT_61582 [Cryphonectria parasitica EP155]KAF3767790.1 hypothetical protein M406DRAFT_61582 [Cryphonectria parasitica EP155]
MTDWSSMKVVELRAVLSSRGLPTRGVKAELIQRLNEADADAAPAEGPATDDSPPTVAASPEASDEAPLPTPVPSSDAAAEMQKRKRRSSTPPPSAKRARQEEERQAEQREDSVPLDASTQDAIKERVAIGRPSGTPQTTIEPQQPHVGDIPMPSIHPPTTSLYIRELMRPLRPEMVEQYIVKLITPPGSEPDANLIEESYLDTIRTHAFVQLASVEAAQRVRAALHNQVWPNERNRKPLWVDFVPPRQVKDFIEREETSPRGGRRWEVVYEQDGGSVVAIHREVGSDSKPFSKPPPTGPAAGPTYPGIEAAPKGPRGRGVRPPFETPGGPQSQQTNAHPRLFFTPLNEDVVQRRLENMRSFYSRAPPPDLGKDYHRFTFENSDSFVDRGREVFIGIRPPHRQKEHEERLLVHLSLTRIDSRAMMVAAVQIDPQGTVDSEAIEALGVSEERILTATGLAINQASHEGQSQGHHG